MEQVDAIAGAILGCAVGLRWWLLGFPAGIGSATLRATLRLWLGFSPSRSGVFSAGNGPAMRSPVLGAAVDDLDSLREFVRISTRLTHTDPKAYLGAIAAAVAAWCARRDQSHPDRFLKQFQLVVGADSLGRVRRVALSTRTQCDCR